MPIDADLSGAWAKTSAEGLDLMTVDLWRHNGLHIGVVDIDQVGDFEAAVGPMIEHGRSVIVGAGHPTAALIGPRYRRPTQFELIGGNGRAETVSLGRGRMQMLAQFSQSVDDRVQMTLVPHHHMRKRSLVPRSPLEAAVDGHLFEAHKMVVTLVPGRAVIIGLYHAPPGVAAPGEPPADVAIDDEKTATGAAPEPAVRPSLGRLLLTGRRNDTVQQRVYIITPASLD